MMVNLFSVFDPSTQVFSLNWVSMGLVFIVTPCLYWLLVSRLGAMWTLVLGFLKEEFILLLSFSKGVGVMIMLLGLFVFIMVNNVFGLVPYVFTGTAHFSLTFSLAIPLLNGLNCYGWLSYSSHMFAHLVPQGTPTLLLGFMVIIETISNSIRPLTLSVRLGANMIAGHLLLSLIGGAAHGLGSSMLIVIFGQLVLLVLEVAVAFIQAYVFVTLMCLYFSELD